MSYNYSNQAAMEEFLGAFAGLNSAASSISSLLSIVAYVFTALALYTIAKRRGIRKAWLAWIPVVDVWILGSISDQFRYVVKGEVKSKRKVLLTLGLLTAGITVAMTVVLIAMLVVVFTAAFQSYQPEYVLENILGYMFAMLGLSVPLLIVAIVHAVFYYMALYDLYTSCDPSNKVLYLVLSIIPVVSSVALPLLLFLCREKDNGMPPRRDTPADEMPAYQQISPEPKDVPLWKDEPDSLADPWNKPDNE